MFGKVAKCVKNPCFAKLFGFFVVSYSCLFGFGRFRVRWDPKGPASPKPSFFGVSWSCFCFFVVLFLGRFCCASVCGCWSFFLFLACSCSCLFCFVCLCWSFWFLCFCAFPWDTILFCFFCVCWSVLGIINVCFFACLFVIISVSLVKKTLFSLQKHCFPCSSSVWV